MFHPFISSSLGTHCVNCRRGWTIGGVWFDDCKWPLRSHPDFTHKQRHLKYSSHAPSLSNSIPLYFGFFFKVSAFFCFLSLRNCQSSEHLFLQSCPSLFICLCGSWPLGDHQLLTRGDESNQSPWDIWEVRPPPTY